MSSKTIVIIDTIIEEKTYKNPRFDKTTEKEILDYTRDLHCQTLVLTDVEFVKSFTPVRFQEKINFT